MKNFTFTFIILYRHNIERLNNLKRVLEWTNGFSNSEVIVVEQDKHSHLSHLNLRCRHIFTKCDIPFNRSWGFNVGLKYATTDIVVFTDCDLIMNPDKFIESLKLIEKYDMVSPYSSVVDLDPNESQMQLNQLINIDRPGRGENDNQKINISGGMVIFKKEAIYKIGGFDENFIGWGGEDDAMTVKVKAFLNWFENPGRCYHLYHSKEAPDMKFYQRNLQLLQAISSMSKEDLIKSINSSNQKMGMRNKYDIF